MVKSPDARATQVDHLKNDKERFPGLGLYTQALALDRRAECGSTRNFFGKSESIYIDWERSDSALSPCRRALMLRSKLPVFDSQRNLGARRYGVGSAF
jgi:hypothetical protein